MNSPLANALLDLIPLPLFSIMEILMSRVESSVLNSRASIPSICSFNNSPLGFLSDRRIGKYSVTWVREVRLFCWEYNKKYKENGMFKRARVNLGLEDADTRKSGVPNRKLRRWPCGWLMQPVPACQLLRLGLVPHLLPHCQQLTWGWRYCKNQSNISQPEMLYSPLVGSFVSLGTNCLLWR